MNDRGANYQSLALLQRIVDALESMQAAEPVHVTQEYITQQAAQAKRQDTIEAILASLPPSTPILTEPLTVTTTETLLYENQGEALCRITVSNDDVAQPMWIGPQGVTHLTGEQVPGTTWREFVMPIGSSLWGITDVGFISVRVSLGYNIKAIMNAHFGV